MKIILGCVIRDWIRFGFLTRTLVDLISILLDCLDVYLGVENCILWNEEIVLRILTILLLSNSTLVFILRNNLTVFQHLNKES